MTTQNNSDFRKVSEEDLELLSALATSVISVDAITKEFEVLLRQQPRPAKQQSLRLDLAKRAARRALYNSRILSEEDVDMLTAITISRSVKYGTKNYVDEILSEAKSRAATLLSEFEGHMYTKHQRFRAIISCVGWAENHVVPWMRIRNTKEGVKELRYSLECPISLNTPVGVDGIGTLNDIIPDTTPNFTHDLDDADYVQVAIDSLKNKKIRNAIIIIAEEFRIGGNLTTASVRLGVCRERTRQILHLFRKHLHKNNIDLNVLRFAKSSKLSKIDPDSIKKNDTPRTKRTGRSSRR